ncbi:MAG: hypothetical protein KA247_02910 [Bacteroidetes bacterium]|nr:hypothetical protein [Bacteroidota bacterium]
MRYFTLLSAAVVLFTGGCSEQGLNPETFTDPGFTGTISFIGAVPPPDSLLDLRVVAVPYYPIDTVFQTLILKIIEGTIPFGENISAHAAVGSTMRYEMLVHPQSYPYAAVVQQFGPDVFSQWKVVSVFGISIGNNTPGNVHVQDGKVTQNINFIVDFYHLPPQPFRIP